MSDEQVERVAASMWRAEAVDSGTPESIAEARTLDAFADQSDELRAKWHKFARAAIAAMQPTPQEAAKVPESVRELIEDTLNALTPYLKHIEDDEVSACWIALRAIAGEARHD